MTLVEMGFVSASLVALHENTAPSSSMLGVKVNTLVVAAILSLTDDVVVLDATPLVLQRPIGLEADFRGVIDLVRPQDPDASGEDR